MAELKPCPFCGGKAEIVKLLRSNCFIRCKKCGCEQKAYASKQNAERAWNRRVNAVPVRCGSCKYCTNHEEVLHCIKAFGGSEVDKNDFCSYGERRSECL